MVKDKYISDLKKNVKKVTDLADTIDILISNIENVEKEIGREKWNKLQKDKFLITVSNFLTIKRSVTTII